MNSLDLVKGDFGPYPFCAVIQVGLRKKKIYISLANAARNILSKGEYLVSY